MPLDRTSGVALWRQIQSVLENDIVTGQVKAGERLPTEQEFAQQFGVNRHTVRQAVAGLVDKGLLRVEQGRGTFVQERVLHYPLSTRTRFSEVVQGQKRTAYSRVLEDIECIAPAPVAEAFELGRGGKVVRLEILGEVDTQPVFLSTTYFPRARCNGIGSLVQETGSVTQALLRLGVADYTRKWTRISARLPAPMDATTLTQPRNRPVLVTESLNVDMDSRPLEYGITRFASDWVNLVVDSSGMPAL